MVTLRLILALSRWSLVSTVKASGEGTRIPREESDQRGFASVYMCASMSNAWPILLVEGLTACRCSYRSQKLGGGEERRRLEEVPL